MKKQLATVVNSVARAAAKRIRAETGQSVFGGMRGGNKAIWRAVQELYPAYRDSKLSYANGLALFISGDDNQKFFARRKIVEDRRRSKLPTANPVAEDSFLESYEWRALRMRVIKKYGRRCQCCGATPDDGIKIHVDHIKARRSHPELALDENNLQVLCEVCNHGKGNWDSTDWRPNANAKILN